MIDKVYVYQMTYGQALDGRTGFVFSSEQEEFSSQAILFGIPIVDTFHHPYDLIESIRHQSIIFPIEINGEYYEVKAKVNFPELIFTIPNVDIEIVFEVDFDISMYYRFFTFNRNAYKRNKYVGKHDKLIPQNQGFLSILPVDLYEMDELYNEHKVIFVGMTPNFGPYNERPQL